MAKSGSDFIHYDGITFAKSHIIAISGSSYELDNSGKPKVQEPFFTVHLAYGVQWRFTAPTESELFDKRAGLIKLLD